MYLAIYSLTGGFYDLSRVTLSTLTASTVRIYFDNSHSEPFGTARIQIKL